MSPSRPTRIRSPHGATATEIEWSDGSKTRLDHVLLRGCCPCAVCQGHSGSIRWVDGTENLTPVNLELRSIVPVGNYALGLTWGDGHDSGIYTFAYLERLAGYTSMGIEQLKQQTFG